VRSGSAGDRGHPGSAGPGGYRTEPVRDSQAVLTGGSPHARLRLYRAEHLRPPLPGHADGLTELGGLPPGMTLPGHGRHSGPSLSWQGSAEDCGGLRLAAIAMTMTVRR